MRYERLSAREQRVFASVYKRGQAMRHYMTDPDNSERLLKIPPRVVAQIKAEAYAEAQEAVAALTAGRKRMNYEDGPKVYGAHNAYIDCVRDALAAIDALKEGSND
jgi:hypothetical protein